MYICNCQLFHYDIIVQATIYALKAMHKIGQVGRVKEYRNVGFVVNRVAVYPTPISLAFGRDIRSSSFSSEHWSDYNTNFKS